MPHITICSLVLLIALTGCRTPSNQFYFTEADQTLHAAEGCLLFLFIDDGTERGYYTIERKDSCNPDATISLQHLSDKYHLLNGIYYHRDTLTSGHINFVPNKCYEIVNLSHTMQPDTLYLKADSKGWLRQVPKPKAMPTE